MSKSTDAELLIYKFIVCHITSYTCSYICRHVGIDQKATEAQRRQHKTTFVFYIFVFYILYFCVLYFVFCILYFVFYILYFIFCILYFYVIIMFLDVGL
jgi:hypothetical protein